MMATTASILDTRSTGKTEVKTDTETFIFRSKFPDIEIPNDQPLHTYCFEKLSEIADRPCLIDGSDSDRMYTFAETHFLCRKTAAGLKRLGVKRKDSIMVLLQNCPEFVFTFMAASMIGAVTTGANPHCTSNEIKKQLAASGARIIVTESKYVEKLPSEGVTIVVIDTGDIPAGCRRFSSEFIDAGGDFDVESEILINSDDPVALPFSSGTTGLPKGVVLTHKNLITSIAQQVDGENPNIHVKPNDVVICVLPLFHIFSLNSVLLCSIRSGCTVLLMKKFEITLFLELIQKHHVSIALVVPPLVFALMKNPKVENYDLSSIRMVHCGAAPLGKDLEITLRERLPQAIFGQGYGMTEAGPVLTMCPTFAKHPFPSKSGSCGTIVRNAEIKIIDPETTVSLRRNHPGEICIRGEEIMKGYLNDPEATARTIDVDGWLHTGDIGYVDDDDDVFIVDRLKELIKVKGFQVPPAELESLLIGNPAISDAAVVAQKDEVAGEVPVAYVVRSERNGQDLTEDDVKGFISKQVVFYKRLHKVYFIASIPKSSSGKILRRKLQSKLTNNLDLG